MKSKYAFSLVFAMLVSGCAKSEAKDSQEKETKDTVIAQQMRVNNNKQGISYHDEVINSLQQCEKSLYVLKELKSKKYQQMLSQYNKTASKVKLYSSVRDSLPKENLDSIGSILLISVQSTCNQIAAAAEQGVLSKISM